MNHSGSFLLLHSFSNAIPDAPAIGPKKPLAPLGQMLIHVVHATHFEASTLVGSLMFIAPVGHTDAHKPHFTHFLLAEGLIGIFIGGFVGILPFILRGAGFALSS